MTAIKYIVFGAFFVPLVLAVVFAWIVGSGWIGYLLFGPAGAVAGVAMAGGAIVGLGVWAGEQQK